MIIMCWIFWGNGALSVLFRELFKGKWTAMRLAVPLNAMEMQAGYNYNDNCTQSNANKHVQTQNWQTNQQHQQHMILMHAPSFIIVISRIEGASLAWNDINMPVIFFSLLSFVTIVERSTLSRIMRVRARDLSCDLSRERGRHRRFWRGEEGCENLL